MAKSTTSTLTNRATPGSPSPSVTIRAYRKIRQCLLYNTNQFNPIWRWLHSIRPLYSLRPSTMRPKRAPNGRRYSASKRVSMSGIRTAPFLAPVGLGVISVCTPRRRRQLTAPYSKLHPVQHRNLPTVSNQTQACAAFQKGPLIAGQADGVQRD